MSQPSDVARRRRARRRSARRAAPARAAASRSSVPKTVDTHAANRIITPRCDVMRASRPARAIERVEHDEHVQQPGDDEEGVAVLVGHGDDVALRRARPMRRERCAARPIAHCATAARNTSGSRSLKRKQPAAEREADRRTSPISTTKKIAALPRLADQQVAGARHEPRRAARRATRDRTRLSGRAAPARSPIGPSSTAGMPSQFTRSHRGPRGRAHEHERDRGAERQRRDERATTIRRRRDAEPFERERDRGRHAAATSERSA